MCEYLWSNTCCHQPAALIRRHSRCTPTIARSLTRSSTRTARPGAEIRFVHRDPSVDKFLGTASVRAFPQEEVTRVELLSSRRHRHLVNRDAHAGHYPAFPLTSSTAWGACMQPRRSHCRRSRRYSESARVRISLLGVAVSLCLSVSAPRGGPFLNSSPAFCSHPMFLDGFLPFGQKLPVGFKSGRRLRIPQTTCSRQLRPG